MWNRVGVIGGRSGVHVRIVGTDCVAVRADKNAIASRRGAEVIALCRPWFAFPSQFSLDKNAIVARQTGVLREQSII